MGNYYQVDNNTGRLFLGSGGFDDGALLAINSTTHGFLLPRMTAAQRDAIDGGSPTEGLVIYNTDDSELNVYDGSMWTPVGGGGGVSYPLLAPDGSTSAPSYSFTSSTNSGLFYNAGSSSIALVNAGATIMQTGTSNQRLSLQPGAFPTNSLLIAGDLGIAQFASPLTLVVASSAIRWGTSNQLSLTASNPSATGRSINLPDPGTTTANVVITESAQSINGAKTFTNKMTLSNGSIGELDFLGTNNGIFTGIATRLGIRCGGTTMAQLDASFFQLIGECQLILSKDSNQIYFDDPGGGTGDVQINIGSSASARVYTLNDAGTNANFIMSEGTQTINGVKSFGNHHLPVVDNAVTSGSASFRWSDVWGVTLHSGDIELDNKWKITEGDKVGHPEEGVMLLSPEGKKFKLHMTEVQ